MPTPHGIGIDTAQRLKSRPGMIHLYTGAGKGKSQAALGVVLRSIGLGIEQNGEHRPRVLMVRFLKGTPEGTQPYQEDAPLALLREKYPHLLDVVTVGRPEFFHRSQVNTLDFYEAKRGWSVAQGGIASGLYSVVVLDELCPTIDLGLLPLDSVLETLQNKPKNLEVIVTGRNPPALLENLADLHTEMVATHVSIAPALAIMPQGTIEIYDGNGKGKSTNALGRLLKSLGESLSHPLGGGVFLHQFLKGGIGYTEDAAIDALRGIHPNALHHSRSGTSEIVWRGQQGLIDYQEAERGWVLASDAILSGQYRAVLLDELNPLVDLELLPESVVLDVLQRKPEGTQVIITGRCKHPPSYYKLANIISTCNPKAHYANQGHTLREGVDY